MAFMSSLQLPPVHGNRPNIFLAIRLTDPSIHSNCADVQRQIVSRFPRLKPGIIPQEKLHITICPLVASPAKASKFNEALHSCIYQMARYYPVGHCPKIVLDGLGCFVDKSDEPRVIFGKVEQSEDTSRFLNCVKDIFSELEEKEVLELGYSTSEDYTPHMTIFKTTRLEEEVSFVNSVNRRGTVQSKLKSYLFDDLGFGTKFIGEQDVTSIDVLSMSELGQDGYYKVLGELSFAAAAAHHPEAAAAAPAPLRATAPGGEPPLLAVAAALAGPADERAAVRGAGAPPPPPPGPAVTEENMKRSMWVDSRGVPVYYVHADKVSLPAGAGLPGGAELSYRPLPPRRRRRERSASIKLDTQDGACLGPGSDARRGGSGVVGQRQIALPPGVDPWSEVAHQAGVCYVVDYASPGLRPGRHLLPSSQPKPLASRAVSLPGWQLRFSGTGGRPTAVPAAGGQGGQGGAGGGPADLHGVAHALGPEQHAFLRRAMEKEGHYVYARAWAVPYAAAAARPPPPLRALLPVAAAVVAGSAAWAATRFALAPAPAAAAAAARGAPVGPGGAAADGGSAEALPPPDRFLAPLAAGAEAWGLAAPYRAYLRRLPVVEYHKRGSAYFNSVPNPVLLDGEISWEQFQDQTSLSKNKQQRQHKESSEERKGGGNTCRGNKKKSPYLYYREAHPRYDDNNCDNKVITSTVDCLQDQQHQHQKHQKQHRQSRCFDDTGGASANSKKKDYDYLYSDVCEEHVEEKTIVARCFGLSLHDGNQHQTSHQQKDAENAHDSKKEEEGGGFGRGTGGAVDVTKPPPPQQPHQPPSSHQHPQQQQRKKTKSKAAAAIIIKKKQQQQQKKDNKQNDDDRSIRLCDGGRRRRRLQHNWMIGSDNIVG